MSLVKFVKGDTTSNSSTYTRQGTGNIEFDSTTKKIYLDGVDYTGEVEDELLENSNNPVSSSALYEVITQNELTTAAALTEHEDAISDINNTISDITSDISDINVALNNKQDANFIVTVTSTNGVLSADKTVQECIKEYESGKQVIFVKSSEANRNIWIMNYSFHNDLQNYYTLRAGQALLTVTTINSMLTYSSSMGNVSLSESTLRYDNRPTSNSNNLVNSGKIYTALSGKQDTLTFDTTPTANSNNPVTSGGIKTYIDNNSPLKVTITYSQIAGAETYLSDKTYSVIQTAITNGRVVKLYYNNKEFDLKSIDSNEVIFERNENDNTYTRIKITNAEYVQVTTGTTLVSGTNIKTINNTSLLGSGDIAVQTPLVSGTDIKTINDQSLLGSGNLDLNPLIFITFWQTDRPTVSSSGQYWYNSLYNTLQLYNGSEWTAVTLSLQKLYIRLATNEIYRYDGREMVRMTLNPTSIVTT